MKSTLDDAILEHTEIDVSAWKKVDEVQFDFERRRISVLLESARTRMLIVKGAPEDILRLPAAVLPFTPAALHLGFVALPAFFFLILTVMLIAYLLAVEGMKRWFFRRFAAE